MANFLDVTIKTGKMAERQIKTADDAYKIATPEMRLTDTERKMLEADIKEVSASFAQLGLMAVGLIPGWGEPADAASAAIDFATGHPIAGSISLFCTCPVAGWLGDIPLLGIRIYRISSSTLKCGKTMFVIARTNNRAGKIFVWMGGKVIEFSQQSKALIIIQKNIFNPISESLYRLFPEIQKAITSVLKDMKVRQYGKKLEFGRNIIKK